MLDHCHQSFVSLLFGCLACLVVTSVVNADGRVFVLDLRNSSGLQAFRDAERACSSLHARLASAEELHHAVVECFFSSCTRGWLYGGTVGTTVCNVVGSTLKAVDVRTENATENAAHLDAFCIKDKGVPCGDPPSFPNARLQGHSGYEMGDELLYTCVPGYVMPSGHSAFSLLCDSCGEWYGLVELCVKDETESHVDYEDKFIDSYGEAEHHNERPEEAHGEVYEEVHGAAYPAEERSQEQQETSFSVEEDEEHQDHHGVHEVEGEVIARGEKDEDRAVEDFAGLPTWEQERREVVQPEAATATEAPVSLLSQKHLFWFPSEAFQEEGRPASNNPVTQTTQRASGAQSEESKEHDSQETHHHQHPVDVDDHDQDSYDDHDSDDRRDHDDSRHDDQDDHDSHQDEDDHDDRVKHYIPAQHDDLDRRDRHETHDDHDDHYDMGEHEEDRDRDRVRYGSQEYDDTYDEHESYEDHEDVTDDRGDDDQEHPDGSEERPDHDEHDDREEHYDPKEEDNDRYDDDHHDHDHHEHDDHDSYDDHDSHEDEDDSHRHAIFSIASEKHENVTQRRTEGEATTDDTWLDGYPVVPEKAENGDSTTERPEDTERRTTDRPNEVELSRPGPFTSLPELPGAPSTEPAVDQGVVEEMWPGFIPTAAPLQPSDSPSYADTLDYDTQQEAPTPFWQGDLTEHPFLDHGPVPPLHDVDGGLIEEHTVHHLPGETGERGETEGEMGEAICTGENCPPLPPSSSGRGPTVAAIIVAVCAVAAAVIVGLWCYRRQQQKSSVYEMNGKGQNQTRQGQQIEMQQKV